MSLDNPTAPPAVASEPPAAPLDGIELAAQGAAEHLADAPAEASPPPLLKKHRERHRFWNLWPNRVRKSGDARLSQGKAGIQPAAPRGRETKLRVSSRR
jgi:hypothetical protein